jgi:hypothetical protein
MGLFDINNSSPNMRLKIYNYFKRVMIYFTDTDYWWNDPLERKRKERIIVGAIREQEISPQVTTEFSPVADLIPGMSGIVSDLNAFLGKVTGKAVGGAARYLDVKGWTKTSQLKLGFKLHFDTETNAKNDVWLPTLALWGYTLPEEKKGNLLVVPGLNLIDAGSAASIKKEGESGMSSSEINKLLIQAGSRLVTIQICSCWYLAGCLLTKAIPVFSTNITESGYPLWADVDCEIETLPTADLTMIKEMKNNFQNDAQILSYFTNTLR